MPPSLEMDANRQNPQWLLLAFEMVSMLVAVVGLAKAFAESVRIARAPTARTPPADT